MVQPQTRGKTCVVCGGVVLRMLAILFEQALLVFDMHRTVPCLALDKRGRADMVMSVCMYEFTHACIYVCPQTHAQKWQT